MAQLVIKGHPSRGKEVIEILEMLGGRNVRNYACNLTDYAYSINGQGIIDWFIPHPNSPLVIFTLEEFLEKFPYKVGDKVKIPNCVVACSVTNMIWNGIDMEYKTTNSEETFFDDELQPYKEETMSVKKREWVLNAVMEQIDNRHFETVLTALAKEHGQMEFLGWKNGIKWELNLENKE